MLRKTHEIIVSEAGNAPVGIATIKRAVSLVLGNEGTRDARVSITFHSSQRMRALNRRTFGEDRATDVIAFPMRHDSLLVGDIYVCPAMARRSASERGVPVREELLRLVVHGTLHLLGYVHSAGAGSTGSRMWRRQEKYLRCLMAGAR